MRTKLGTSTLLVLLSLAEFAAAGEIEFNAIQNYPVGQDPRSVAAGDFDQDGKLDLAVMNQSDATISILLGKGDGTFLPRATVAGDTNALGIAAIDLNGDQRLDLVIAGDSGVSVLLGNGDATFQAPRHVDGGTLPYNGLRVADFNSDGKPDLAVANRNGVSVLLGNGDGTFQAPIDNAIGSSNTTMIAGDFNGDTKQDLVVVGSAGLVTLLGNGDGTFQSPLSQNALSFVRDVADFNKDGKLDLLVDNGIVRCGSGIQFCGAPIGIMLGNGDGTFQAPGIINHDSLTLSALTADFDGDGNIDVGVIEGGGDIAIFLGNGAGQLRLEKRFPLVVQGGFGLVVSAVAADFTGDKAPDIAGTNAGADYAAVLVNNTGSDFSISASPVTPATLAPGQSATSTVTLSLLNAFDAPVSLACSIQAPQAGAPACSLSSTSVTFDTRGRASSTLTIRAGASLASVHAMQPFSRINWLWLPVAALAFFESGLGIGGRKRRLLLMFPIGLVLISAIMLQPGCGGGGSTSGPKSTPYTVMITGTSGATQHATTVNLTIQ
jgi:hypothetical protein